MTDLSLLAFTSELGRDPAPDDEGAEEGAEEGDEPGETGGVEAEARMETHGRGIPGRPGCRAVEPAARQPSRRRIAPCPLRWLDPDRPHRRRAAPNTGAWRRSAASSPR